MNKEEEQIVDIRAVPEGGPLIGFPAYIDYDVAVELMQKGMGSKESVFLRTDLGRTIPKGVLEKDIPIVDILITMDMNKEYYLKPLNHLN